MDIVDGKKKKFAFCPTLIVTPLIFSILRRDKGKIMIYGQAGIAKTTAIIFYCYLSGLISEYDCTKFTNDDQKKYLHEDK